MGTGGMDHWKDGRDIYDSTHLTVQHENQVVVTYTCLTTNSHEGCSRQASPMPGAWDPWPGNVKAIITELITLL